MIYHLSLHTAGVIAGAFLVVVGVLGLMKPDFAQVVKQFPRSRFAGVVLLTICLAWTFWLLATIQMGEFSSFRRPLLIALPIGYVLTLFVRSDGAGSFANQRVMAAYRKSYTEPPCWAHVAIAVQMRSLQCRLLHSGCPYGWPESHCGFPA